MGRRQLSVYLLYRDNIVSTESLATWLAAVSIAVVRADDFTEGKVRSASPRRARQAAARKADLHLGDRRDAEHPEEVSRADPARPEASRPGRLTTRKGRWIWA